MLYYCILNVQLLRGFEIISLFFSVGQNISYCSVILNLFFTGSRVIILTPPHVSISRKRLRKDYIYRVITGKRMFFTCVVYEEYVALWREKCAVSVSIVPEIWNLEHRTFFMRRYYANGESVTQT